MPRCVDCDSPLSDFEATRRHGLTRQFLDLCDACLPSDIPVIERSDLLETSAEDPMVGSAFGEALSDCGCDDGHNDGDEREDLLQKVQKETESQEL